MDAARGRRVVILVGMRIVIMDRAVERGRHCTYAGRTAIVRKLNGSSLLVELVPDNKVVWIVRKSAKRLDLPE